MPTIKERLEAQKRTIHRFDASIAFPGIEPGHDLGVRLLSAAEYARGHAEGIKYLDSVATGSKAMLQDATAVEDAKSAGVLSLALVEPDTGAPIFSSVMDLASAASVPELSVCVNLYAEVLRRDSPLDLDLPDDRVEALADALGEPDIDVDDVPNRVLARYSREQLGELAVRFAQKLHNARGGEAMPSVGRIPVVDSALESAAPVGD